MDIIKACESIEPKTFGILDTHTNHVINLVREQPPIFFNYLEEQDTETLDDIQYLVTRRGLRPSQAALAVAWMTFKDNWYWDDKSINKQFNILTQEFKHPARATSDLIHILQCGEYIDIVYYEGDYQWMDKDYVSARFSKFKL